MSQTAVTPYYQSQIMNTLKDKSYFFYLGLCTILLIGSTFFVAFNQKKTVLSDTKKIDNEYLAPKPQVQPKTYIVQETDSLSSIALAQLGDGEKWVDIAKLNNITDPNTVVAGMKLVMPSGAVIALSPTVTPTVPPAPTQVTAQGDIGDSGAMTKKANPKTNSYTVQEGEGLWQIAEKVYGDGEMWVEIMKANNLQNPDQIVVGMKLKMPHIK